MTQETPTPDPRFEMTSVMAAIDNALRKGSYMTGANFAFLLLCDHLGVDRDRLVFRPDWASSERTADPAVRPVDAPTAPTGTPEHPERFWWHHDDLADGDDTGVPCAPTPGTADGPASACVGCGLRNRQWRPGWPNIPEAPAEIKESERRRLPRLTYDDTPEVPNG